MSYEQHGEDEGECSNCKGTDLTLSAKKCGHNICFHCHMMCQKSNEHHCVICYDVFTCYKCEKHECIHPRKTEVIHSNDSRRYCESCREIGKYCENRACVNEDINYKCEIRADCGHVVCDDCSEDSSFEECFHCEEVHCPVCKPVYKCVGCGAYFCETSGCLVANFQHHHAYCIPCDKRIIEEAEEEEEKEREKERALLTNVFVPKKKQKM